MARAAAAVEAAPRQAEAAQLTLREGGIPVRTLASLMLLECKHKLADPIGGAVGVENNPFRIMPREKLVQNLRPVDKPHDEIVMCMKGMQAAA